jgi:hypothetical protein
MMRSIQKSREPLQPKPGILAKGMLTPDATAAKRVMPVVYILVINPILWGSFTLINGISNTLPITMPMPVSAVPKNKRKDPPKTRIMVPTPMMTRPRNMALAFPSFLPIPEAKREKVAKVRSGKVVRKPAQAFDRSKSSRMSGIKGPTAVIEGLRLKEIKIIPNINRGVPGFFCTWRVMILKDLAIEVD